ncbi:MAG: carbon-nitrogen hydrolase family protein [Flavobacteriales bacterium]|nr:carbon-nitrogen hydrolase family protein [Flavobacteriales bacterium]
MKICAAQTKPIKGDFLKNIENHLSLIKLASESNADLVIFPELSISGYEPTLAQELATNSEDKRFDIFQAKSDENDMVIAIGAPLRNENDICIGMVVFQPQQKRSTYLKKHLFHTEKAFFKSGQSFTNLTIKDVNIGLAICYELSVPEHQKVAVDNGSEIYIASVVDTIQGIDDSLNKMSRTASNYSMVTLLSNCIGISGKYNCAGKSSIWNQKGKLMGQLGSSEEGVLIYDTESKEILKRMKPVTSKELG